MTTSRRLPAALWILAPLALALLYAVAHPLLARKPDVADVVPQGAVLAHRFRDLAAVDRSFWWFGPPDPRRGPGRVGDRIGALRNVPGLAGVDRKGPFHWVLLARDRHLDATMAIFALADEDAFRAAYEDPRLLELGHVRHAQNLEIRGRFAAVARDGDAARRIGTAGLVVEDRGEDHALVADVAGTLRYALLSPVDEPWRGLLSALGYASAEPVVVRAGETPVGISVPAGRAIRVMNAWSTLRAWFWQGEGRITVELEPSDGAAGLREALAAVPAAGGWTPGRPQRAQAWLWVPTGEARAVLWRALYFAGVDLPDSLAAIETEPGAAGGVFAWAEVAPQAVHAWTIGLAAPSGPRALDEVALWVPGWPGGEEGIDLAGGAAPITVYDPGANRPAPLARAVRRTVPSARGELVVGAVGPDAAGVAVPLPEDGAPEIPAPPAPGLRPVALFYLDEPRAKKLLGSAFAAPGPLLPLAGAAVEGSVWTDGRRLRVDLRRAHP
jgi:hypothetical protein